MWPVRYFPKESLRDLSDDTDKQVGRRWSQIRSLWDFAKCLSHHDQLRLGHFEEGSVLAVPSEARYREIRTGKLEKKGGFNS